MEHELKGHPYVKAGIDMACELKCHPYAFLKG
jgi:hypothetical protein